MQSNNISDKSEEVVDELLGELNGNNSGKEIQPNSETEIPSDNIPDIDANALDSSFPLTRERYLKFSYSKKSHFKFFQKNNYDEIFYGRQIPTDDFDIKVYQNLFIYSFIKQHIPEGSRILEIGNGDRYVIEHFRYLRECFRIENVDYLMMEADKLNKENIPFLECVDGKKFNKLPVNEYDFIFTTSGFDEISCDENTYQIILDNINTMLKPGGLALTCFTSDLIEEYVCPNNFLFYLTDKIKPLWGKLTPIAKSVQHKQILSDPDLHTVTIYLKKQNESGPKKTGKIISYNYLWRKNFSELPESALTNSREYLDKMPAFIFHHLMKCGGSSMKKTLQNWFYLEYDNLEESGSKSHFLKYKFNAENINSDFCLIGHFQYEGIFIHQRYPEMLERKNHFKLFTFIRDPLQVRISLHYYNIKIGNAESSDLKHAISQGENFLASAFPCTEENYKKILDRYFFIGIVEKMQESYDLLADILNKKRETLPFENKSEKDSQISLLTEEFISEFKNRNKLDYMIYDYCLKKLNDTLLISNINKV